MKQKILIVDDHPMMCRGIKEAISTLDEFQVCGMAHTIPQALQLISKQRPEIIILDLIIGNQNGLDLLKMLKNKNQLPPTIIFSMSPELVYAERCLKAGAQGYVMKNTSVENLLDAIQNVAQGKTFFRRKLINPRP